MGEANCSRYDVICCGSIDHQTMAVDARGSTLLSDTFLGNHRPNSELDLKKETTSSPHLSRKSLNDLESSEKSGIPLNTAWTLWHDK